MNTFFINLLFGHFVGDYLLQNNWMALSKNGVGIRGYLICAVHCLIYTASIVLFTGIYKPLYVVLIFFSHFLVDKFSIAEKWLQLIRGRSIDYYLIEEEKLNRHIVMRGSFTGTVYVAVDNTMHMLLMYYGTILLGLVK